MTLPLLVLLSLIELGLWFASGLWSGIPWVAEVAIVMTTVQGVGTGLLWPRFWHGKPTRAIFGAGGRFVGFELAVVFGAAEAQAVGTGFGTGEPLLGALLLAPPLVIAALALRGAVRAEKRNLSEVEGEREGE